MTPLQLRLLTKLDQMKYNKHTAVRFKNVVFRLERTIKKYHDPHRLILKGESIMKQYLHTKNYTDHFKIKSKHYKITKKNTLIPVHISNVIHDKAHFILFMVRNKSIYRIDPTFESHSHIKDSHVKMAVETFFKGYRYKGYAKWNKNIHHGGLCRWISPYIYKYRKRLTYRIIKKEIICYFLQLIK